MKKIVSIVFVCFVLWVIVTAQVLNEREVSFQETMQWIKDTMGKDPYFVRVGGRTVNTWKYVVSWEGCNVTIVLNGSDVDGKKYSESSKFALSDVSFEYEMVNWIKPNPGSRYGVLTFKTNGKKITRTDSKVEQKDSVSFPFGGSEAMVDCMINAWNHVISLCRGFGRTNKKLNGG